MLGDPAPPTITFRNRVLWCAQLSSAFHGLICLSACTSPTPESPETATSSATAGETEKSVLLLTKTAAFRHASIPNAIQLFEAIAQDETWTLTTTEDAGLFSDENLATFDAVIFANTTGDILNDEQELAFEHFIQAGGGFAGIHAAADTEPDWPFYIELLGTHFSNHPDVQTASILVDDTTHPATQFLPDPWERKDEWYNFTTNPRPVVHVLLSVDEKSYEGGSMGDHPLAWTKDRDGQRTFYTALGHTPESYDDPAFITHVTGGLRWVLHLE